MAPRGFRSKAIPKKWVLSSRLKSSGIGWDRMIKVISFPAMPALTKSQTRLVKRMNEGEQGTVEWNKIKIGRVGCNRDSKREHV